MSNERLRIELQGPRFPRPTSLPASRPWPDRPMMWRLIATVPAFGLGNVRPKEEGTQEDRIPSLRSLLLDPADGSGFQAPRLTSVELIAGQLAGAYEAEDEGLTVFLGGDDFEKEIASRKKGKRIFRTDETAIDTKVGPLPPRASFEHVVAEPFADDWSDPKKPLPMRLVAGAVDLRVVDGSLPWLGELQPSPDRGIQGTGERTFGLRLLPDGIELKAELPFPRLDGGTVTFGARCLLVAGADGLELRLLLEHLDDKISQLWCDHWTGLIPADAPSSVLPGFHVRRRKVGLPAFVWHVAVDGHRMKALEPIIEVAGTELDVRLVSPREPGGTDGEVTVQPDRFRIAPASLAASAPAGLESELKGWTGAGLAGVVLSAELVAPQTAKVAAPKSRGRLRLRSKGNASCVELLPDGADTSARHECAHDERRLAEALRRAHGLEEPRPGRPDYARPVLQAFVPVEDGWLQIPAPNVPPADVTQDVELLKMAGAPGNVLSGYLRFSRRAELAGVLSAFGDPGKGPCLDDAPWMVTVEGAEALSLILAIGKDGSGAAAPKRATAYLDRPELSTRGLVWLSSDRPDAFEALPRLGAGPGAYLDLALETLDTELRPAQVFGLERLELSIERKEGFDTVDRTALQLRLAFNRDADSWLRSTCVDTKKKRLDGRAREALDSSWRALARESPASVDAMGPAPLPPVLWQRHPRMPLAASLPMTRSAASAVRPLESRELVPFALTIDAAKGPDIGLFRLLWRDRAVFPVCRDELDPAKPPRRRPVAGWPWPPRATPPERGIALAAFGAPGAELAFDPKTASAHDPWSSHALAHSLRYDLPALDEVFASSSIPPGSDPSLSEPTSEPIPTALDWPLMKRFWDEQERRQQNSRVAHAHLTGYHELGTDVREVEDLVRGATWSTELGFEAPTDADMALPYGRCVVESPSSEEESLLGKEETFTLTGSSLTKSKEGDVRVLGWAPGSFLEDGYLMDARRSGSKPRGPAVGSALYWQSLRVPASPTPDSPNQDLGLATLLHPIAIGAGKDTKAAPVLKLWFKDLPIEANGVFEARKGIDFEAWQDGRLPRSGYEWRLTAADDPEAAAFKSGRGRVPLLGLELEPLRLESLRLEMKDGSPTGRVLDAEVLCRLHLGPDPDGPEPGGNLVAVALRDAGNGADGIQRLRIDDLNPRGGLFFTWRARDPESDTVRGVDVACSCGWDRDTGLPTLASVTLRIAMLGTAVKLTGATASLSAGETALKWSEPSVVVVSGRARLAVSTVEVIAQAREPLASLQWVRVLRIAPETDQKAGLPAPIEIRIDGQQVTAIDLFALRASVTGVRFQEGQGGFNLALNQLGIGDMGILPGFKGTGEGKLSLGLAASVKPDGDGFWLAAGSLEGEIVYEPAKKDAKRAVGVFLYRVGLRIDAMRRSERGEKSRTTWSGELTLHGRIAVDNAIAWPRVLAVGRSIPWDVDALDRPLDEHQKRSGRTVVRIVEKESFGHAVDYVLDGHRLSLDLARRLASGDRTAVWTTLVAAQHTLRGEGTEGRSFVAVETISIGTAEAIVPRLRPDPALDPNDPTKSFSGDPVTRAPRYQRLVDHGKVIKKASHGMLADGRGRVATVLKGALGYELRSAFWPADAPTIPLVLAGGFVGLIGESVDEARVPLVRIPVLARLVGNDARLEPGRIRQNAKQFYHVAWMDGYATSRIVSTSRNAVTPAGTDERSLTDALLIGSRRPTASKSTLAPEGLESSLLVEQSFVVPCDPPDSLPAIDLGSAPFFMASAVSVSKLWSSVKALPRGPDQDAVWTDVLSLVAGSAPAKREGPGRDGLAAALSTGKLALTGDPGIPIEEPRLGSTLTTIGDDVVSEPWKGPETVSPSLIAGPAFLRHVEPRAVLIRRIEIDATNRERYVFVAVELLGRRSRTKDVGAIGDRVFEDAGRGFTYLPDDSAREWPSGIEEGATEPIREAGTGLAGLVRSAAMPARASRLVSGKRMAGSTWFSQLRAPVYLSLSTKADGPALPWLSPGAPRPRLPVEGAVAAALDRLETGVASPTQAIVPESASIASVGDRAGVVVARVARLERELGGHEFDARFSRFGRPAQGGVWSVRSERTPRPGPLPANNGDPRRDRRPCSSSLLPLQPLDVLMGPADRIAGSHEKNGEWTVTLLAAPDWSGLVSPSWDGTIPLTAEIDVRHKTVPPPTLLFELLFEAGKAPGSLRNQASLVVASTSIPFQRLHVLGHDEWRRLDWSGHSPEESRPSDLWRASVEIVLDARPADASWAVGAPIAAIGEAMSGAEGVPTVELRFLALPSSGRTSSIDSSLRTYPLSTDPAIEPEGLAAGGDRAPVTLTFPLSPVVPSRGGLPLAPSSIVFIDPSYDASLASQPGTASARVSANGGKLATDRGDLMLALSVDSTRVNRRATVSFMLDAGFEGKLDGFAREVSRKVALNDGLDLDGDLVSPSTTPFEIRFALDLVVIGRSGTLRRLRIRGLSEAPRLELARVYELCLSALVEESGAPARLEAGDVLQIKASELAGTAGKARFAVWDAKTLKPVDIEQVDTEPVERAVRVVLTDDPVVAPPPALYAALMRRELRAGSPEKASLSLPLYAQSPLPWRVDLREPKAGFREGLMRRSAVFVWTLSRPSVERTRTGAHVVKVERGGQMYLPPANAGEDALEALLRRPRRPSRRVDVSSRDPRQRLTQISALLEEAFADRPVSPESQRRFLLYVAWHEGSRLTKREHERRRSFFGLHPDQARRAAEKSDEELALRRLAAAISRRPSHVRDAYRAIRDSEWPKDSVLEAELLRSDLLGALLARYALQDLPAPIPPAIADQASFWADSWHRSFATAEERSQEIRAFEDRAREVDLLLS